MKDESRDLYRIDPLKVRRKVFESYPPGSRQRADMIKEEKLNELGQLSSVVAGMPREMTETAVENIKSNMILLIIKFGFFTFVALALGLFIILGNLSSVDLFSSIIGTIIFSYLSLRSLLNIYVNYKLIKDFAYNLNEMETKISKLKRDIFDDPRR